MIADAIRIAASAFEVVLKQSLGLAAYLIDFCAAQPQFSLKLKRNSVNATECERDRQQYSAQSGLGIRMALHEQSGNLATGST